jgi:hypothetical protein
MQRSNKLGLILLSMIFGTICCLCIITGGAAVTILTATRSANYFDSAQIFIQESSPTPVLIRPTTAVDTLTPQLGQQTDPENKPDAKLIQETNTLTTLRNAKVPESDIADLARRLEAKSVIPATLIPPVAPFRIGTQDMFWVIKSDGSEVNETFHIRATLEYVTDHAYFWVEDGSSFKYQELVDLAQAFENEIYPTNRAFFGSEQTPGIDGDPHVYILYAHNLGGIVVGYFSPRDSYHPLIQEYSNGHEMFVFNLDKISLDKEFTYGTLAHEFQHMIHFSRDRNETSWLNEGFSDLAMFLNGYDIGGHDFIYVKDPDIQLNDWPNEQSQTIAHYGASFLFMTYFLDRFGELATQALVTRPENGLESIDLVMAELGLRDPLTGALMSADDVFRDWVAASYLQDTDVGDGRFTYHNYPDAPQPGDTETIEYCDQQTITRDVKQYGVDYISLQCRNNVTLYFEGSVQVNVLPADPYSGEYAFWSNKGDESNMTLTKYFDFREHIGPLTLSYMTWFDIEKDYDYLYLVATVDGENWQIINTPSGTADDPTGASYGWAYNGASGGGKKPVWINEQVDLTQYVGKEVGIRFEYITDGAVNGEGFLLDDVSIPEIGYSTDFETDEGGWIPEGFVRIQNTLPQDFLVSLIRENGQTDVEYLELADDNTLTVELDFEDELSEAVLVVSGSTRYTRQPAAYRFSLNP